MEPYKNWSREELIARLQQLDRHDGPRPQREPLRPAKDFDFSAYPKRKIALKFTYNGIHYGGMEIQKTPGLPTVEGVLFDALVHTKLVDREGGLEGCGWQRCGRTDKGVSAGGQVVSLYVRSALGDKAPTTEEATSADANTQGLVSKEETSSIDPEPESTALEGDFGLMGDWDEPPTAPACLPSPPPRIHEFPYIWNLNHILPPTIRVLAWSPVADDFSARFSCRYRHYKYFFSPAGLDLAAMRDAAARLVGEHDFRNLCKIDPGKQLTVFTRRILHADIQPADAGAGGLYVFNLRGNAFLYNMVRNIMAVLFLVGTGLERPAVVSALLNTDPAHPAPPFRAGEPAPPVVESKPDFQLADALPLMLWECGYDAGALDWRTDKSKDDEARTGESARSPYRGMAASHERAVIGAALEDAFLRAAQAHHAPPPQYFPLGHPDALPVPKGGMLNLPLGGGTARRNATYVPLLERKRLATAHEVNERYRLGRGAKKLERRAGTTPADEMDE